MASDINFILGPVGSEYSMISDDKFDDLQHYEHEQSTSYKIAANWLLNVKKFCTTIKIDNTCTSGIYKAEYSFDDLSSYTNKFTTFNDPNILSTSPVSPHTYTKQSGDLGSKLTGDYLGSFFHHKGEWYASYEDIQGYTYSLETKTITDIKKIAASDAFKKTIYVLERFFSTAPVSDDKFCSCYQMTIFYSWVGTDQYDLDTKTEAFGESVGFSSDGSCGDGGDYVQWISDDNTDINGQEQVDIRVDDARQDGLWTSSYNIKCYAGWYEPAGGSGPANLIVTYKGTQKTKSIDPGEQNNCASTFVATVTVYAEQQKDGSYFEIV